MKFELDIDVAMLKAYQRGEMWKDADGRIVDVRQYLMFQILDEIDVMLERLDDEGKPKPTILGADGNVVS